jgi:hypothetical protein
MVALKVPTWYLVLDASKGCRWRKVSSCERASEGGVSGRPRGCELAPCIPVGNTAINGWSWPNFWAGTASLSLGSEVSFSV